MVEHRNERQRLAGAIGVDLTVCSLRAELPVIHQRLTHRHNSEPEASQWHLDRSAQPDGIPSRAAVDDFSIDATTRSALDAAVSVIRAANWQ
ncbi:hypothetical protein [Streptomyces zhihengii]